MYALKTNNYLLKWVIEQSQKTWRKIINIKKLINEVESCIEKLNMDYSKITKILFSYPFLTIKKLEELLSVSNRTVLRYIELLEKNNIIKTIKIWRNKLIYIPKFIKLLS